VLPPLYQGVLVPYSVARYHTNNYAINLRVNYPCRNSSDRVDYNVKDNLHV
jgi:hypothetical protein